MIGLEKKVVTRLFDQSDPKLIVTRVSRTLLCSRDFVPVDIYWLTVALTSVVTGLVLIHAAVIRHSYQLNNISKVPLIADRFEFCCPQKQQKFTKSWEMLS